MTLAPGLRPVPGALTGEPPASPGRPRAVVGQLTTVARTLAVLALLQAVLPVTLVVTALAWAARLVTRAGAAGATGARAAVMVPEPPPPVAPRLTVMVSGGKMTKALQLARSFSAAGHRVVLVEASKYRFTGHRFSTAVDRFHTVPAPQDPGYTAALVRIAREERVDVYVPVCSPAASQYDAEAKVALAEHCEVLHLDADTVRTLDDKHAFAVLCTSLGLASPRSYRITSPQQVLDFDFAAHERPFILKSIPYDPVHRLDLTPLPRPTREETAAFVHTLPISEEVPWVLQEFIPGQEFCAHATVRGGAVTLYCASASSAFQINYAAVDDPAIEAWVTRFVAALGFTGQVCFDFIRADDGTPYAIECNPRTHTAVTMFHDHPGVAAAYLGALAPPIRPLPGSRPTYFLYHELWRMVRDPRSVAQRVAVLARGKDAIFNWSDPLPFLLVHHLQIPSLLLANLRRRRAWTRIDFNIGKLVEPAGD